MTKKEIDRKPSFVHHGKGKKKILVGEFHYGSASDSKVLKKEYLGMGEEVKLFESKLKSFLIVMLFV